MKIGVDNSLVCLLFTPPMFQFSSPKTWTAALCTVSTSLLLAVSASANTLEQYVVMSEGKDMASADATAAASHVDATILPTTTINGSRNVTLNGTGLGLAVVRLTDLVLSRDATLTLKGSATDVIIINVTKNFWLNSARVVLSGGLTSANVLFNYVGTGEVRLTMNSSINGNVVTPRKINLSGKSSIKGHAIASSVARTGGSTFGSPAFLSGL